MDMGVENRHLYTADVTRTLPVSGTFTALQRQVYDIVYASQQAGMDFIKPGVKFKDADLIGIPYRITVGKKTLEDGSVDVLVRTDKREERVKVDQVAGRVKEAA